MRFLRQIFGSARAARVTGAQQASQSNSVRSQAGPLSPGARRELLRAALRDTLHSHGVPAAWIESEMLVSTSHGREPGIHWRLLVKHWEPRLMTYGVAFQQSLVKRVTAFDPMASNWLTGISWQFALADESLCPAMPPPAAWRAPPNDPLPLPPAVGAIDSGDVVAGPVQIAMRPEGDSAASARADLERLMALRDADFKRHSDDDADPGSEPTQPMFLATEPGRL